MLKEATLDLATLIIQTGTLVVACGAFLIGALILSGYAVGIMQ